MDPLAPIEREPPPFARWAAASRPLHPLRVCETQRRPVHGARLGAGQAARPGQRLLADVALLRLLRRLRHAAGADSDLRGHPAGHPAHRIGWRAPATARRHQHPAHRRVLRRRCGRYEVPVALSVLLVFVCPTIAPYASRLQKAVLLDALPARPSRGGTVALVLRDRRRLSLHVVGRQLQQPVTNGNRRRLGCHGFHWCRRKPAVAARVLRAQSCAHRWCTAEGRPDETHHFEVDVDGVVRGLGRPGWARGSC